MSAVLAFALILLALRFRSFTSGRKDFIYYLKLKIMDDDITTALCSIIQLFINKQKKMEDELKLLLISCEIEESNLRYYESIVEFLSLHENSESKHELCVQTIADGLDYVEEQTNLLKHTDEWTEDRTQRLLDSLQTHYSELIKNKDYAKPVWEIVRQEVDASDPHLKWYTCRHKWSHLESDYKNYIKDLKEFTDRNSTPELMLYVPQHYKQIGNIIKSCDNQSYVHNQGSTFLQKILEDRISEALKSNSWIQLGRKRGGDDIDENDVITISGVGIGSRGEKNLCTNISSTKSLRS
ncbi:uncharacterized protein isoform X3 [Rhodnius prolixus]|uniref:uncharacterized protein isoform X3 n=1 Tax=Rhodnius prolixus TaxID=13249 RepID=UPI003D18DAF8